MGTATANLAKLKNAKPKASGAAKTKTTKTTAPKSSKVTPRVPHPWAKIKEMYEADKTKVEISDALKIKLSTMNGIMDRLAAGVVVNGKTIKINRTPKTRLEKK